MQITVKGKNFDVTEALRSHATQKVDKTSRYSDAVISAEVMLTTERNWHVAEVTLFGKGFDMHVEEKSKDMYNSIDRVVEKLERQLKKQREKVANHRGGRIGLEDAVAIEEPPQKNSSNGNHKKKSEDKYSPRIDAVHRFVPQTMTIDEAIKELESASYQFVCFVSEDTGRLSIVHKKNRGYGLLEPRLDD